MSVIWVIEQVKENSVTKALLGDFAVRAFASWQSFKNIGSLNSKTIPEALIIDGDDCRVAASVVLKYLGDYRQNLALIWLVSDVGAEIQDSMYLLFKPIEALNLSLRTREILNKKPKLRNLFRYQDLLFDNERHICRSVEAHESISLPLKEAQVLKFFMENPGICLSRNEIISSVWNEVKVTPRTLDCHISRLRKRIIGTNVQIESVYGGGYVMR